MEAPSGAPADANDGCVAGTAAAGTADSCAGCPNQSACATGTAAVPDPQKALDAAAVASSLASVGRIILVLSGKGGVGKSTVSTQFAWTLAAHYGFSVGLLDVDICGPSAPRMCGVARSAVRRGPDGRWTPVYAHENLAVMSVGFLTPNEDDAIVWRGPRKEGMIRQFLSEVNWCADGEMLDYLVVDTPPGTSDEHMSIVNHLVRGRGVDGAVVVTTSEEVSMADVRKELNFCTKVGVRVLGVVENMASMTMGFGDVAFHRAPTRLTPMEADPLSPTKAVSPALGGTFSHDSTDDAAPDSDGAGEECTQEVLDLIRTTCPQLLTDYLITTDVFRLQKKNDTNTPKGMAAKFNVPYLGGISLDRNLLECCEKGVPLVETFPHSPAVAGLMRLVDQVLEQCPPVDDEEEVEEDMYM